MKQIFILNIFRKRKNSFKEPPYEESDYHQYHDITDSNNTKHIDNDHDYAYADLPGIENKQYEDIHDQNHNKTDNEKKSCNGVTKSNGGVELKAIGSTEFEDNPLYAGQENGIIADLTHQYSVAKPTLQNKATDGNRNGPLKAAVLNSVPNKGEGKSSTSKQKEPAYTVPYKNKGVTMEDNVNESSDNNIGLHDINKQGDPAGMKNGVTMEDNVLYESSDNSNAMVRSGNKKAEPVYTVPNKNKVTMEDNILYESTDNTSRSQGDDVMVDNDSK